jgi:hypothetical protein
MNHLLAETAEIATFLYFRSQWLIRFDVCPETRMEFLDVVLEFKIGQNLRDSNRILFHINWAICSWRVKHISNLQVSL